MGGMGGMGGMGMGGMGGGMGGMGGGMGMFNVPPGVLPQGIIPKVPAGGFQAFSVKDDLDLSEKEAPAAAPAKAKATPAPAVAPIDLKIEKDVTPETAWDRYFRQNPDVKPAAIRQTVRKLWEGKKYDQVVSLVRSALRNKQAQPWMYEAMTLSMLAANWPAEEIERAVMSAVDFAENPADLMLLGAYCERQLEMPKRALQIYRLVSQLQPALPQPYLAGLRVAGALKDLEGIQWSTVGILSQAWPANQQEVWETGRRVAAATLEQLRSQGRKDEAARFEKALDEAVTRDCVAMIHWNGEADLDLYVQEPTGTVCSIRNPRTINGGSLVGDSFAASGKKASGGGFSEIYVCPKGFSGDYTLIIRRVWGKVTADKVTVEVYLNARTAQEKLLQQTVTLKGDEARLKFSLADGRRTENLKDVQIAKAANDQVHLRQHVLAQQLAGGLDPAAMMNLALSRALTSSNGGNNGGGGGNSGNDGIFPFLRGAVGYQPVIITLPEGANLMAMAVISADRRYVRYTGLPLFSGVAEVNTFNMATGENATGQGGTGGQGFGGMGFGQGTGNVFGGGNSN